MTSSFHKAALSAGHRLAHDPSVVMLLLLLLLQCVCVCTPTPIRVSSSPPFSREGPHRPTCFCLNDLSLSQHPFTHQPRWAPPLSQVRARPQGTAEHSVTVVLVLKWNAFPLGETGNTKQRNRKLAGSDRMQ